MSSIFSDLSASIRRAGPQVGAAAVGAGSAFIQDRYGVNLERINESGEKSRTVPLGTGAVSTRAPQTDTLAPGNKWIVPVAIAAGVLLLAAVLIKAK